MRNAAFFTTDKSTTRFLALLLPLGGLCLLSVAAACSFGPVRIPFIDCLQVLFTSSGDGATVMLPNGTLQAMPYETLRSIVVDLRLPRVLLSLGTGGCLALAGVVFQGILRNPLADPFTLGVSSGAACGAAIAISFGLQTWAFGFGIAAFAFVGALSALGVVLLLGGMRQGLQRESLVLAGIIVSSFLAALISLVKALDESSVTGIVFWVMGSFQGRTWAECLIAFPGLVIGVPLLLLLHRELDMLHLGDTASAHLGVPVVRYRLLLLVAASAMTAGCVAVSGIIGFVGLVVPHLCRLCVGAEHRFLLPLSLLVGGLLLVWSDVAARSLLPGGVELPVGVITALLGGPFFCYLLYRQGKSVTARRHGPLLGFGGIELPDSAKTVEVCKGPPWIVGHETDVCVSAKGLSVRYGAQGALADATFSVAVGESVALLGPNGSGKSSLLRCLAGVQRPCAGTAAVFGQEVFALSAKERAKYMAVLPQRVENVPTVPVFSFALMGRYPHTPFLGQYTIEDKRITLAALHETGVAHLASRSADTLSGGELQRVLLARCLAQQTPLLLLDEATTGLDPTYQTGVFSVLAEQRKHHALTVIAAMHDLNLAALYCDRIIVLRQGQIVADGPVEEVFVPEILEYVYETPLRLVQHPQTGRPQVVFLRK